MKKLALLIMLCLTICMGLLLTACGGDDEVSVSGGCKHQFEESVILEPTCTTLGSKVMTCKLCGVSKDHSTIPTTEHNLYYTDNEPATCTADGYSNYACYDCDYTKNEYLPATGHDFEFKLQSEPTTNYTGYCEYTCKNEACYLRGNCDLPALTDPGYEVAEIDEDTASYTYTVLDDLKFTFTISSFKFSAVEKDEDYPYNFDMYILTGYEGSKTSITLPSVHNGCPVVGILEYAFYGNETLTSVTFAESTFTYTQDDIKEEWRDEFTEYVEPSADGKYYLGYQNISRSAFASASALTSVTLSGDISGIDDSAFEDCMLLEEINLENVLYIEHRAFSNCAALESVDLSSLVELEYDVFQYCSALESVTFSSSLKKIGGNAFTNCTSLTSFVIPDSVEEIGASILKGCTALKSLTAPKIYWNKLATFFSGYTSYDSDTGERYYYGSETSSIPTTLESVTLTLATEIGNHAFEGCNKIKTVNLPATLESIGTRAFNGCTALTGLVIPDGVKSIGSKAFSGVEPMLYNQDFDNKAYYIPSPSNPYFYLLAVDYVASGEFVIRDGCKFVEYNAFSAVTGENVTAIRVPSSVEYLGTLKYQNGYGWGTSLNVYFDGTVERFTELGFATGGWQELHLYTPSGSGYAEVTELVISNKVTEITESVYTTYGNFVSFVSVRIPTSITKINSVAFRNSTLTSVYYEGTLADWCAIEFMGGDANPMSVTEHFYLKDGAGFSELMGSVTIPESVTHVDAYAFYGFAGLTELIVPSSVERINVDSYENCANLTAIYYEGTALEWEEILYSNSTDFNDPVPKYYYSETEPSLDDILGGGSTNLWHYDQNGKPAIWGSQGGASVNGNTYVYTSSTVEVTDAYWVMICQLKDMGAVDEMGDPDLIAIVNAANTKEELNAGLAGFYGRTAEGLTLSFGNGTLTLAQNGASTELGYVEYNGDIYSTLTEGKIFSVNSDASAVTEKPETPYNEYLTVTHIYVKVS